MFEAERHALPVEDTRPAADAVKQPVPVARKSCVVEALVVKRDVVVAFVEVELSAVKF
jgi:hypothetical protein